MAIWKLILPNLFISIGEAAEARKSAIIILIDEMQYFNRKELSSLIVAMHKIQQRQLPIVLLGAGLQYYLGLLVMQSLMRKDFSIFLISELFQKKIV